MNADSDRPHAAPCLECGSPLTAADERGLCARCLSFTTMATMAGDSPPEQTHTGKLIAPPAFPYMYGGYRVLRLLGRGGMGVVYEAESAESGRRVALKVLSHSFDSVETRRRFLREGRLAASLNHPHTVYVYGTEEIEQTPVITMELVAGGTLQDRVKASGPLPVREAVDAILQVMAGLEAAHAAGILHRDVKPANCFVEPGGLVKIGDFGLSISTSAREESDLTASGAVMGTPTFASPEQLRGEAIDVRADLYSVGVTLYYLLTGRPPFLGENMVALLAAVLEKAAPSPREFRPEIPEPLARVILRCLAKPAGERFPSYEALRHALLPFTSTAPTPATLGLRVLGGTLDYFFITLASVAVTMSLCGGFTTISDPKFIGSPQWLWSAFGTLLFQFAYYAASEARWGATPGKALMGLRVVGPDRNAPSLARALARTAIYLLPAVASFLLAWHSAGATSINWVAGAAYWLYPLLLLTTARPRNGFATVLDLLTKTSVIQRAADDTHATAASPTEAVAHVETLPRLGPFHVLATLQHTPNSDLLLGYDAMLLRHVWIRQSPAGSEPVAAALRNLARPGRLRWLQGHRDSTGAWDAYEASPGVALLSLVREPQPWSTVRHWLCDLAEELAAAASDGSLPAQLSLDHVWVTVGGRARLLDFPAPSDLPAVEALPGAEPAVFLNQLALSALRGQIATADEGRSSEPRQPLPIRARTCLHMLRSATDLTALAAEFRALVRQRPAISRRRRLGLVAGCLLPALLMGGFGYFSVKTMATLEQANPDVKRLQVALSDLEQMGQGRPLVPPIDPVASRPPLETYIAGRYGRLVRDPAVWSSLYATTTITGRQRQRATAIVARVGQPSAEAMAEARAALGPALDARGELVLAPADALPDMNGPAMLYAMPIGGLFWIAFFSLAAAVVSRGGLLLRALGIAVVRRDGSDASRFRLLWRASVAWSLLPLGGIITGLLMFVLPHFLAAAIGIALVLTFLIWSAARPGRSLQDLLAGTWLVPR